MTDLDFHHLALFLRIAETRNLSAVARERGVPASQVSRALARIELACGARLVHRSTHGLSLTPEGETFAGFCRRVGGALEEVQGEFSARSGEASGRVRVAASTVVAQYLLVPSLASLAERHPRLHVDLEVSDRMADMARDGIDIAIRTADPPETMVARRLGSFGRALYASPAYAERFGLPAHPDELAGHALVSNSAVAPLNQWPFVVDGRRVVFVAEGRHRSNDTGMTANMVLQGLGIGRLATIAADPLVRQRLLLPVLPAYVDPQVVPVNAVLAASRQRLPKIRACVEHWARWIGAPAPATAA